MARHAVAVLTVSVNAAALGVQLGALRSQSARQAVGLGCEQVISQHAGHERGQGRQGFGNCFALPAPCCQAGADHCSHALHAVGCLHRLSSTLLALNSCIRHIHVMSTGLCAQITIEFVG